MCTSSPELTSEKLTLILLTCAVYHNLLLNRHVGFGTNLDVVDCLRNQSECAVDFPLWKVYKVWITCINHDCPCIFCRKWQILHALKAGFDLSVESNHWMDLKCASSKQFFPVLVSKYKKSHLFYAVFFICSCLYTNWPVLLINFNNSCWFGQHNIESMKI